MEVIALQEEELLRQIGRVETKLAELRARSASRQPSARSSHAAKPRYASYVDRAASRCEGGASDQCGSRRQRLNFCPTGHELVAFYTPRDDFFCDCCGADVPLGALMRGCRACNWDRCQACFEQRAREECMLLDENTAAAASSMVSTRTQEDMRGIRREVSEGDVAAGETSQPCKDAGARREGDVAAAGEVRPEPRKASGRNTPCAGDIVSLGTGAPPEFRQNPAVITQVAESHCTVVVLDGARRYGIGQCWPSFKDVVLISDRFRLGTRVVIDGLKGTKKRHLNGASGSIVSHPQSGHPAFVHKASQPEQPRLAYCVELDDSQGCGESLVLLEQRFLAPYEEQESNAVHDLECAIATLSASLQTVRPVPERRIGG